MLTGVKGENRCRVLTGRKFFVSGEYVGLPLIRWSVFCWCGLLLLAFCSPAEARHLKVYSPQTGAKGEIEFAYWLDYFAETDLPLSGLSMERDGLFRHTLEIEYGVTDDWTMALYGDWEDAVGETLKYVQTRLESKHRLFRPGEQIVEATLYLEYAIPRHSYEEHHELEAKLLLQRAIGPLVVRLNPVVEQAIRGDEGFELGYEAGVYAAATPNITPGVEFFGALGPARNFDPRQMQQHSIGPVVKIRWGELTGEFGAQFGITRGSDDMVVKVIISFAIEPH